MASRIRGCVEDELRCERDDFALVRLEKRTSVAEAVKSRLFYGTAKPVPFVGRFISQAPAVNEKLPVLAKVTNLKKLIWTGL
jgi:hypothetical protein